MVKVDTNQNDTENGNEQSNRNQGQAITDEKLGFKLHNLEKNGNREARDRADNSARELTESNGKEAPPIEKDNRSIAKDGEEKSHPQGFYSKGNDRKKSQLMGGKGPLIAIFGGLSISVVIVGLIVNVFSSLLINLKEILFNDHQSNSTRTNLIHGNAMRASMFTKGKCVGKVQILCKFQSMSEKQIKKLTRAGFTVNTDPDKSSLLPGRQRIQSIVFPDGEVADTARGFHELAGSSPQRARWVRHATLGKTAYFLNAQFDKALKALKLDKLKALVGRNREELDSDVDRRTNGSQERGGTDAERRARATEEAERGGNSNLDSSVGKVVDRVKSNGKATQWIAAPVVLGCGAYDLSHMATAYAKKYHIEQMAKYAMIFMNTADRIKTQGDIDPEAVSYAGKILTDSDPRATITDENGKTIPNDEFGKAATDAQAYEIAAHGDKSDLTASAQKFKANGASKSGSDTSWLDDVSNITKAFEIGAAPLNPEKGNPFGNLVAMGDYLSKLAANGNDYSKTLQDFTGSRSKDVDDGRKSLRWLCSKAPSLALAGYAAFCAASLIDAISTAGGNPLGALGIASLIGCAFAAGCQITAPAGNPCGDVIDWAAKKALELADEAGITEAVLKHLQSTAIGSFTRYTDAGNAIGAGEAFIGEKTANAYALRPATDKKEVQEFLLSTSGDMEMEDKLAFEDAQATPFDITNQYSFLSTVVRSAGLYYDGRAPVFSSLASIFSMVPSALTSGQTAKAYYSQPVQTPDQRYDCDDPDLLGIGIKQADKFCNTNGITPEGELEGARQQADGEGSFIEDNVNYMTKDQPENEIGGGTQDDSFCDTPLTTFTQDCETLREASKKRSIDDNGKEIAGSQYEKYIKYCTEQRNDPWGVFSQQIHEAKTTRDIDWFTGKQCLKDTKMMQNFRTFYNMCTQQATMDDTPSCYEETSTATPGQQSGDACSLINNPNIVYEQEGTKKGLQEICDTGHTIDGCDKEMTLNPVLTNVITTLSSKYKIWLNNFGFKYDRNFCESGTYQHPKGNAIDLNGIEILNGGGKAGGPEWGGITFGDAAQVKVIESYATDWLAALPRDRGGVGQQGCGGKLGGFNPTFPPDSTNLNGSHFFADSCDHLHIDVRNRSNLSAA